MTSDTQLAPSCVLEWAFRLAFDIVYNALCLFEKKKKSLSTDWIFDLIMLIHHDFVL